MTKLMVHSLLAIAVTASMALANGGEGEKKNEGGLYQGGGSWSFKPGSGITYDGGDTFKLTLKNQLQAQWAYTSNEDQGTADTNTNNFTVRRARTGLSGHVWSKDITFKLMLEAVDAGAAGDGAIKDGWVQWAFMNGDSGSLALRAGQGKSGFGLEATGTSGGLDFVERSMATRTMADVRSRGAWLHGSHSENKFRWNFGAQNGDVSAGAGGVTDVGEEANNSDNEVTYVANVSFDPMGDFVGGTNEHYKQGDLEGSENLKGTIGAGVMIGNGRAGGADVESTNININTAWKTKGLAVQGEVFIRTDDPAVGTEEDTTGWYAQGTYTLPKSGNSDLQWGFGVRVAMVETDNTAPALGGAAGDVTEITGGINAFYHGHACKTQLNYTNQDVSMTGGGSQNNHVIAIQMTLIF